MCTPFDRETFQKFLANAFAVQQSQINRQSLVDIMEIQRSVASGKVDLDGIMSRVVESARTVANASGVAIGLLHGSRLIYRYGSGTSAVYVGQQVTASLTVSAATRTSREILRVEDAQRDSRIEADICRQFGAHALLILPIYQNGCVAGVFDVRFSEAHAFDDLEVRTYRLMAEQIEAAMSQAAQLEENHQIAPSPADLEPSEPPEDQTCAPEFWMGESSVPSLFDRCQLALAEVRQLPVSKHCALFATTMIQRAKQLSRPRRLRIRTFNEPSFLKKYCEAALAAAGHLPKFDLPKFKKPFWVAARMMKRANFLTEPKRLPGLGLAAAVLVLTFTGWFGYRGRPFSPSGSSTVPRSTDLDRPATHPKPLGGETVAQPDVTSASLTPAKARRSRMTPKRVLLGDNAIYDIGDDVTVRLFTPRPAVQRARAPKSRISHIGDDVTVRYFSPSQPTARPVVSR